jgi:hypothetical protein
MDDILVLAPTRWKLLSAACGPPLAKMHARPDPASAGPDPEAERRCSGRGPERPGRYTGN